MTSGRDPADRPPSQGDADQPRTQEGSPPKQQRLIGRKTRLRLLLDLRLLLNLRNLLPPRHRPDRTAGRSV